MSNTRSGYTRDIAPERLDGDEARGKAVPVASGKGKQNGLIPVAQRDYTNVSSRVVTVEEAQANMSARMSGAMPLMSGGTEARLKGGSNTAVQRPVIKQVAKAGKGGKKSAKNTKGARRTVAPVIQENPMATNDRNNDETNYDPLGGDSNFEPGDPALEAEERALASNQSRMAAPSLRVATGAQHEQDSTEDRMIDDGGWLAQRGRATLTLADGMFNMSVIDIKECQYGITILLPMKDDAGIFIPKPGAELTIGYNNRNWECFFPGTHFEIPELKLMGLVFVRKEN